jgi:N-acetylglucosaminyl-diphospho-decaprenol L-rhamnosyltransferase
MISVVVVNHDGAPLLARCLGSLAPPPGEEVEAIVVDNASGDCSPELVRRRFPAVRLLALPDNVGFGAAVNRGAAVARGEALLLLNNDAWLAEGCLAALAARLAGDPGLAWVAPRLSYPDGRPQTVWSPDVGLLGEAVQLVRNGLEGRAWNHGALTRCLQTVLGPGWYTAACALVRREAFEAVGGFDEGFFLYFEDSDLCLRLRRAGWRLAQEPAARASHALTRGWRSGRVELEYRRSQLRFYALHRPRWEAAVLRRYLRARYRRRAASGDATARAVLELLAAPGGPKP